LFEEAIRKLFTCFINSTSKREFQYEKT
jgi:hypothetical protein